jgi:hypothetical protein
VTLDSASVLVRYDSYGHPICSPSAPKECRYNWNTPPPDIPQAVIDYYGSHHIEHTVVSVHELLGISETMSAPESTRISLFEEITKSGMQLRHVASSIRHLEGVGHRQGIPNDLLAYSCILVGISRGPFVYSGKDHTHIIPKDEDGYTWLDPRTFLRFTTHLDDERNLQASVVDLVTAATKRPMTPDIVFGIGLSCFHCVIVRINLDDRGSLAPISPTVRYTIILDPRDYCIGEAGISIGWATANGLLRFPHIGDLVSNPTRRSTSQPSLRYRATDKGPTLIAACWLEQISRSDDGTNSSCGRGMF